MGKFLAVRHHLGVIVPCLIFGGLIVFFLWREWPRHGNRLMVCDVGQGDAIVLQTQKGSIVLVDGGPGDSVLTCLGQAMPFWDRTIEMMMLTHAHADHETGLRIVEERLHVEEDFTRDTSALRVGQQWKIDETTLTLLANETDLGKQDLNDQSLVLLWETPTSRVLLTGDASARVEERVIARWKDLDVDLLKVGHHGSKTSTSEAFLLATQPEFALISAGLKNRFGHPDRVVLERLRQKNVAIWETRTAGIITCDLSQPVVCEDRREPRNSVR
jgi:competence protein ComEC